MRLDERPADEKTRLGIWRCTVGTFRCAEKGDELQTIARGWLGSERTDGTSSLFEAGGACYSCKGEVLVWGTLEDVDKVFFTYERDGR